MLPGSVPCSFVRKEPGADHEPKEGRYRSASASELKDRYFRDSGVGVDLLWRDLFGLIRPAESSGRYTVELPEGFQRFLLRLLVACCPLSLRKPIPRDLIVWP